MQYRFELAMWIVAESLMPLIALAVWYQVAKTSGAMSPQDTLTYYVLVMFINVTTNAWNGYFLAKEILDGDIIRYLVRPFSAFWPHIANNIVEKSIKLLIPLPALIIILSLFPHVFSPSLYSWQNFALFVPSLILAVVLSFTMDMIFGTLAFWLEDSLQLRRYREILHEAASGLLVPFAFMPLAIQTTLNWLPFRHIIATPAEIMLGQLAGVAALRAMLWQVFWSAIFILAVNILWQKGVKRYAVPGQ